jgi:hypothetical protein
MKIIVVCYYYTPEITPRAFRASSIVESLIALGHEVELVTSSNASITTKESNTIPNSYWLNVRRVLRLVAQKILPGGRDLRDIPFYLQRLRDKDVDLIISIGLPFSVHLSVAISKRFLNLKAKTVIFDYGDPYSTNPAGGDCFYAETIEKWALKYCDVILTPVKEAVPLFKEIAPDFCRVEVIPQGYEIKNVPIKKYEKNSKPTFAYAGAFYEGIREPLSFLKYLSQVDADFLFVVYTNMASAENMKIIKRYSDKLGGKLKVLNLIPRNECLLELSKMDFLINFSNQSGVQQPSKIVDYTLSGRPFLNVSNDQATFEEFELFFINDFSDYRIADISMFDQGAVASNIIMLTED